MSFVRLITGSEPRENGFALTIPGSWHQGRTAYGGFSASLALTAAQQVCGAELAPLRSASISFIGPAYGNVEVQAKVLRKGRNATWIGAEVIRDGEVATSANFVFMGPVASALHLNDCPVPKGIVPIAEADPILINPNTPQFIIDHFDMRHAQPRSDRQIPELCRWVRLKDRTALDPMTEVLLLADSLPPGVLPLLAPATPISSMTWQANLLTPTPLADDGWFLLRSFGDYAENGCSSQIMRIWNGAGQPVMSGMQSVAVFG